MEKINIRKFNKIYFSYPNTVTLVLTKLRNKINLMPAAWQMPLSYSPPLFGVLISPKRYTYSLLTKSKDFTLNFVEYKYSKLVTQLGSISGRNVDKIKNFNLELEKSRFIKSPILKIAYVSFECKLQKRFRCGDHWLVIGKILNIRYRKGAFNKEGDLNVIKIKPLLYLGNNIFTTTAPENCVQIKLF